MVNTRTSHGTHEDVARENEAWQTPRSGLNKRLTTATASVSSTNRENRVFPSAVSEWHRKNQVATSYTRIMSGNEARGKLAYRQDVVKLQLHHGLLPVDNSLHDIEVLAGVFAQRLLSARHTPTPEKRQRVQHHSTGADKACTTRRDFSKRNVSGGQGKMFLADSTYQQQNAVRRWAAYVHVLVTDSRIRGIILATEDPCGNNWGVLEGFGPSKATGDSGVRVAHTTPTLWQGVAPVIF